MGTNLPIRSVCRNCGTRLEGRYCHVCGQDVFAGTGGRLRDVLVNSLDVVFAFDGKVWRSMAALVARPGKLTREWLDGRIVRYVHPSKLFWFLSIIFFALLVETTGSKEFHREVERQQAEMRARTQTGTEAKAGAGQQEPQRKGDFEMMLEREGGGAVSVTQKFLSWAPYLMLVMAPVFALVVRLFYRRRELYYADYLVFALHFHAFVFLLYSLTSAAELAFPALIGNRAYQEATGAVELLVPWIYLIISLRRVFGAKFAYSVLKTIAIAGLYLLAMLTVLVGASIGWMAVMGKQG